MPPKLEYILRQIEKSRKLKGCSIRDCAAFLQISKMDYIKFERGEHFLSLPEIELLAFYLDAPLQELFVDNAQNQNEILLRNQVRQDRYKQLRHKMIRAKFIVEQNQSLEKIHELTQIPMEQLESYRKGDSPIPLDHLLQICDVLELTPNAFLNVLTSQRDTEKTNTNQEEYSPEFPQWERENHEQVEDPYVYLLNALKRIPIEDQADIAKTLLNKLKTE